MNKISKAMVTGEWKTFLGFLDSNGDVNIKDKEGRTALINAVISNNLEMTNLLIQKGADVNLQDSNGYSALHFAAQNNFIEIANILLKSNASVNSIDVHGNTPLFRAVFNSKGKGEMTTLLLSNGADKNQKNKHGMSPFDLAKSIANYDIVKFLE